MSYHHDRPGMFALGAGGAAPAMRCPSREEPPDSARRPAERPPAVDERLIMPGNRYEVLDGKLLFTPPADEPHGTAHLDLAAVLRAHVTAGYRGAVDMLTRTSKTNDHAPDASIYPLQRDPATGGRQLEELAFEIVSEQSMSVPTSKARDLVRRGVRRVFCIDVGTQRVLEWSRERDDWDVLSPDGGIEDHCLVRPLPVRVLLDATLVDDALASALVAKKNPVVESAKAEAKAETASDLLLRVLGARRIAISEAQRARILACKDPEQLAAWTTRAAVADRLEDVLRPGE